MAIEGLGRVINAVPVAAGQSISLRDAQGVTFIAYGAAEAVTLQSSVSAGAGQANLAIITRYYTNTAQTGTAAWVAATQAAAATVTIPGATAAVAFYVDANDLPAGQRYVNVNKTTAALVVAIVHDLQVQRDPKNLPALSA